MLSTPRKHRHLTISSQITSVELIHALMCIIIQRKKTAFRKKNTIFLLHEIRKLREQSGNERTGSYMKYFEGTLKKVEMKDGACIVLTYSAFNLYVNQHFKCFKGSCSCWNCNRKGHEFINDPKYSENDVKKFSLTLKTGKDGGTRNIRFCSLRQQVLQAVTHMPGKHSSILTTHMEDESRAARKLGAIPSSNFSLTSRL